MSIWTKLFNKITFKDYPDTTTPLNATNLNTLSNGIDGLDDRVLTMLGDFASQYAIDSTYKVGDYVIYDGKLYKCITAVTEFEEWDSSKWQNTDCGTEFNELNSNLSGEDVTCIIRGTEHIDEYPKGYKCVRYGNLLHISGDITSDASGFLLSVPTNCIPKHNLISATCTVIGDNNNYFLRLSAAGNLVIYTCNGVGGNTVRCLFDATFDLG